MRDCPHCFSPVPRDARFCPFDGAELSNRVAVGSIIADRFELLSEIGSGAMGTVFAARQLDLDRIVAVKVLHRHFLNNFEVRARFAGEIAAVARLNHPHIVALHESGEASTGQPFLVMEHVDGVSLESILDSEGTLSLRRVLTLGRQMIAGLGVAHRSGVAHRDFKPANVLVTDLPGMGEAIKIVDFGVAKWIDDGDREMALTGRGSICGTPEYMAPEQALGERVDHRIDLYAFGVLLYRMLTGKLPFEQVGVAVMMAHISQPPPSVAASNPHLPEGLVRLVERLLAKDPADRPADAYEVMAVLDELLSEEERRRRHLDLSGGIATRLAGKARSLVSLGALLALVALGAGVLAHAASSPSVPARSKSWVPAAGLLPRPLAVDDEDARAPLVIAGGDYSVRLLAPRSVALGEKERVYLDVWDRGGYPIEQSLQAYAVAPSGARIGVTTTRTAMPGRYVIELEANVVGRHMLSIQVGPDVEIAAYLDVDDRRSRS